MSFLKAKSFIGSRPMQIEPGINRSLSESISFLRFPLIVLVVCIHVDRIRSGFFETWWVETVCSAAVPCYFVISGILFFKSGFNGELYRKSLRRRVGSLLVPYLAWNTIAIIFIALKNYTAYHFTLPNILAGLWDAHYSFIEASGHSPMDFPLWYVRDLMVCCVLSPVIFFLIKRTNILLPGVVLFLWILGIDTDIVGLSIISLAFFSLGGYIALYGIDITDKRIFRYGGLTAVLMLLLSLVAEYGSVWQDGYVPKICDLTLVSVLFPVGAYLSNRHSKAVRMVTELGKYVFFIYAAHALIVKPISGFVYSRVDSSFFAFVSSTVITLTMCLIMAWTFRKLKLRLLIGR